MKKKEDEDMQAVDEKHEVKDKITQSYEIDNNRIKELVVSKESVVVKNGVMQIDPSHPDYDFWMED